MEREKNNPPAWPWERKRLSSIKGRIGEKTVRLEKFASHRHQKTKRGNHFIDVTLTLSE